MSRTPAEEIGSVEPEPEEVRGEDVDSRVQFVRASPEVPCIKDECANDLYESVYAPDQESGPDEVPKPNLHTRIKKGGVAKIGERTRIPERGNMHLE